MYRNLLRSVTHAGVRGLLVHDVKNEVEQALNVSSKFKKLNVLSSIYTILVD